MTKLTEVATYSPTIFRLETTTPVAGGAVVLDGNDDPIQGHANVQAQLLANRTKYLKGVTDTLGTASTANVTTSAIDTTAGRVMKVGAFGVGTMLLVTDADAVPKGGSICVLNTPFANGPSGNYYTLLSEIGPDGTVGSQLAIPYSFGSRVAFRVLSSGTWGAWKEVWTSEGTNAITVDTAYFGYGTGSGGSVTQATSKSTAVTLNKPSGRVTTTADSLAAGADVSFQFTNSKIAATDIVLVTSVSGPGAASYELSSWGVSAGFCYIRIRNISASAAAHAININFVVIKGAIA